MCAGAMVQARITSCVYAARDPKKGADGSVYDVLRNQRNNHRIDVVRRRTEFDLGKARDRAHILEGLKIALDNLDEVITLIRNSADTPAAKLGLQSRFGLSERQSEAMRANGTSFVYTPQVLLQGHDFSGWRRGARARHGRRRRSRDP